MMAKRSGTSICGAAKPEAIIHIAAMAGVRPSIENPKYYTEVNEEFLDLQEDELADGGWYKLDQLPTIPPQRSIARYLIDLAERYIS